MTLVDLNSGKTDLAIRYGSGIIRIFASSAFSARRSLPVCSRALRDSLPSNAGPADLKGHSLLHDDSVDNDPSCPTWPMWLRAAGVQRVDAGRGPRFSQSSLVLEAAALGQGFALQLLDRLEHASAGSGARHVVAIEETKRMLARCYFFT
jgi:LysR family transcriptional regulator, glycine cleavage system transcriptional activator